MRIINYILLFTFLSFFNACSKSTNNFREGTIELALHDCIEGKTDGNNLKLCFNAIISDSRCPANARCIWQGTATAQFFFTKDGHTESFELSTVDMQGTYKRDTTINGFKIEFLDLSPYPGTYTPPLNDKQVKAKLQITKI